MFMSHESMDVIGRAQNRKESAALSIKLVPDIIIPGISRYETALDNFIRHDL